MGVYLLGDLVDIELLIISKLILTLTLEIKCNSYYYFFKLI